MSPKLFTLALIYGTEAAALLKPNCAEEKENAGVYRVQTWDLESSQTCHKNEQV